MILVTPLVGFGNNPSAASCTAGEEEYGGTAGQDEPPAPTLRSSRPAAARPGIGACRPRFFTK